MSHPDFSVLVRRRDEGAAGAEEAWDAALAHAEECASCAAAARAAEPLLLFRGFAGGEDDETGSAAEEVQATRVAVATLRRAAAAGSRLRHAPETRAEASRRLPLTTRGPGRALTGVAASLLLAASLVLVPGPAAGPSPELPAELAADGLSVSYPPEAAGRSAALLDGPPRPGARVYELRQEDLAVVMIVDETLDV